jgi:hypothetical protein
VDGDERYCDFREGYNCYAVSSEKSWPQLLDRNDTDIGSVTRNARKLLSRHVTIADERKKIAGIDGKV